MDPQARDLLIKAPYGDSKELHATDARGPDHNQHDAASETRKIRWKYPALMVVSLLLGAMLSVAHHMYYKWLNGQDVGSTNDQQWSLRYVKTVFVLVW